MIPAEWAQEFQIWKSVIVNETGLAKDALHIYAGLAIFILVRLLWRWRFGWSIAWITAMIVAVGTEFLDIAAEGSHNLQRPNAAHWHDIWNTMFWPSVLAIFGRWMVPLDKKEPPENVAISTDSLTDERA